MEQTPNKKTGEVRVPDDAVPGWMQTLREGGHSDAEIDRFFSGLNIEYFRMKMPKDWKERFERDVSALEEKRKKRFTPDERKKLLEEFHSFVSKRDTK